MKNLLKLFVFGLMISLMCSAQAVEDKDGVCTELKSRLNTATDHMSDTIEYLMSGKTDMSTIGQRIEDGGAEANRVLKDINIAISDQQVTLACRNDLQVMVIEFQSIYHEVGERIRERVNVYSF